MDDNAYLSKENIICYNYNYRIFLHRHFKYSQVSQVGRRVRYIGGLLYVCKF